MFNHVLLMFCTKLTGIENCIRKLITLPTYVLVSMSGRAVVLISVVLLGWASTHDRLSMVLVIHDSIRGQGSADVDGAAYIVFANTNRIFSDKSIELTRQCRINSSIYVL